MSVERYQSCRLYMVSSFRMHVAIAGWRLTVAPPSARCMRCRMPMATTLFQRLIIYKVRHASAFMRARCNSQKQSDLSDSYTHVRNSFGQRMEVDWDHILDTPGKSCGVGRNLSLPRLEDACHGGLSAKRLHAALAVMLAWTRSSLHFHVTG